MQWAGFAGILHFALCNSGGLRARMPCTMAGMDQRDSHVAPQLQFFKVVFIPVVTQRLIPTVLLTVEIPQLQFLNDVIDIPGMQCRFFQVVFRCVQRQVPSAVAVHLHGRLHPHRGAEAFQTVCRTRVIPQLLDTVVDAPVIQVEQFPAIYIPVVAQRLAPMVRTVRLTVRFSSCWTW